jgi:hypothetical protein
MLRLRPIYLFCIATFLGCFLTTTPASAQTPDTGLIGVGGDIGVFFPDEAFEKTLTLDGYGEYYVTPRISVRTLFGWAKPGFENQTENHFRQVKLLFNGVYNWEMGTWHPYATFGAGAYFVRVLLDDVEDPDSETRGGINFGGGIEYFMDDRAAIKGEVRWDIVSEPPGLPDASGFTFTLGYKRYF